MTQLDKCVNTISLHKKCPSVQFLWSVFSLIQEIFAQTLANRNQKMFDYRHFLRSVYFLAFYFILKIYIRKTWYLILLMKVFLIKKHSNLILAQFSISVPTENVRKTESFLVFPGDIEIKHWDKIGERYFV